MSVFEELTKDVNELKSKIGLEEMSNTILGASQKAEIEDVNRGAFVKINKDDLKLFSGFDVVTLVLVNMFHAHDGKSYLNYSMVIDEILFANEDVTRRKKGLVKQKIITSLEYLDDIGYIHTIKQTDDYTICTLVEKNSEKFIKTYEEDVLRVYNIDTTTQKKDSLVMTYLGISQHIWDLEHQSKYCFVSYKKLEYETGLCKDTLIAAVDILELNRIYYVYKFGWYITQDGEKKECPNFYSQKFIPNLRAAVPADIKGFSAWDE